MNAPYTPAMAVALKDVPRLGSDGDLSREAVIATKSDLVVGDKLLATE